MAILNFNLRAFLYQDGLKTLIESFNTSATSLENQINLKNKILKDDVDGKLKVAERDENGVYMWCEAESIQHEIDVLHCAHQDLKKAFIIAAYHNWERYAQSVNDVHSQNFDSLCKKLFKETGHSVNEDLYKVNNLINLLKHNNKKHKEKLLVTWPTLFKSKSNNYYDAIHISNEDINLIFGIISSSGEK